MREHAAAGRTVTVVHHIDADGVTSGAIAAETLSRAGVAHILQPVKALDQFHLDIIARVDPQALWFCDLGSTAYMHFPTTPRLVCDHHELVRDGQEESFAHVNPLLDGIEGNTISGAGCCYLVAAAMDGRNADLLPLALVGASGDRQDRHDGGFAGTNALLVADGQSRGLVSQAVDITWFGPETRPLRKFFQLSREPGVPTVSGDARSAERLCMELGIPIEAGGVERSWGALDDRERLLLRSRLASILVDCGLAHQVPALFRRVVTICNEAPATPLRELQEFSTLLNSTARYDRPEIGLAVCRGDRGAAYREALDLLLDHRKHLVGALDALVRAGVTRRVAIQHVHLQDRVRDTVVGIVCGMALGGGVELDRDKVLVGLAWTPDGRTKISGRAPHELHARGIDLSMAMREAAAGVGGQGGGHKGAAGATIPRDRESDFLAELDRIAAGQIGVRSAPTPPRDAAPEAPRSLPVLANRGQQRLM